MGIDAGILAGDIYNALAERGVTVRQVLYYAGGGWYLKIANRGGLLLGVPIVTYSTDNDRIEIRVKRLFSSTLLAFFSLKEMENKS
jgi:hypothetical protein